MKSALLWNTYGGDIEWFRFSARSYKKFATGWHYAKCIVPNRDIEMFRQPCAEAGIFLAGFDEWPGKGFNHHQAMTCMADLHFPPDAEVIFHIDADTVFADHCTPAQWIHDGKVLLMFSDFTHFLKRPLDPDEMRNFMGCSGKAIDFNRGQYLWKFASDFALGWSVGRETMACMPIAHRRHVYPHVRKIIEAHHRCPFEQYVQGCRNEFPQTFCEFNTIGAVAHRYFQGDYRWWNVPKHGYPFWGKVIQCHSHSGFDYQYDFGKEVGGTQSPRQLFQRLGL